MIKYKERLKKKAVKKIRDSEEVLPIEELWLEMAPSREELEDVLEEVQEESSESLRLASLWPVPECLDLPCIAPQVSPENLLEKIPTKRSEVSGETRYATEESFDWLEQTCGFWGLQAKLVLEKAVQTLKESEDTTSAQNIVKLLFDVSDFRLEKISELKDPPLRIFWQHVFPKTNKLVSYMLACRLLTPIVSKIERDVIETHRALETEGPPPRTGVKGAVRLREHRKKLEELKPIAEEMGELVPQRVGKLVERIERLEQNEGDEK